MAKKIRREISLQIHQGAVKDLLEQITTLRQQIEQRDQLLRFMQNDHNRSVSVANRYKDKVRGLMTFIEGFANSYEGFRTNALDPTAEKNEFDTKTQKDAAYIQRELNNIFGEAPKTLPNIFPADFTN